MVLNNANLLPALLKLREAGVSRVSLDDEGNVTEVEFFASAPAPVQAEEVERPEPQEPEVPSGYLNAVAAYKPKKQGAA